MSQELPFQLAAWLKKQRELELSHREKMVQKSYQEDREYMRYISFLVRDWGALKNNERLMICNFTRWHTEHRCFTGSQRSAIAGMYVKYSL